MITVTPSTASLAQNLVNQVLNQFNPLLQNAVSSRKNTWQIFWDPGTPVAVLQAALDLLASTPVTDPVLGSTNALLAIAARGARFITYSNIEDPTSFSGLLESTGVLQPNGQPYQMYQTPGWYYTVNMAAPSHMAVSAPCTWNQN